MIYLASPYSHPDPEIMQARYEDTLAYTLAQLRRGRVMFSPIVYGHHLGELGTDAKSWAFFNDAILSRCSDFEVLMLPGWAESVGVKAELKTAERFALPIWYVRP